MTTAFRIFTDAFFGTLGFCIAILGALSALGLVVGAIALVERLIH